jgi:hypothetical protein
VEGINWRKTKLERRISFFSKHHSVCVTKEHSNFLETKEGLYKFLHHAKFLTHPLFLFLPSEQSYSSLPQRITQSSFCECGHRIQEEHNRTQQNTLCSMHLGPNAKIFYGARFYCSLLTLHVSAPCGGHLQVVRKYNRQATLAAHTSKPPHHRSS